jgi:hypothetical protein
MRYLIDQLSSWLRYRREKRWMQRDPYGYFRAVMGVPDDMTDEEIDAKFVEMGELLRETALTAEEAAAGMRAMGAVIARHAVKRRAKGEGSLVKRGRGEV